MAPARPVPQVWAGALVGSNNSGTKLSKAQRKAEADNGILAGRGLHMVFILQGGWLVNGYEIMADCLSYESARCVAWRSRIRHRALRSPQRTLAFPGVFVPCTNVFSGPNGKVKDSANDYTPQNYGPPGQSGRVTADFRRTRLRLVQPEELLRGRRWRQGQHIQIIHQLRCVRDRGPNTIQSIGGLKLIARGAGTPREHQITSAG